MAREEGSKNQNTGFIFTFNTSYVSIIVDRNFRQAFLPYFRKMEDIIEIIYDNFKIIIFKCKWVGTERDRGYKKWNLNGINLDRFIHNEGHEEHDCTLRHLKHKWCIMLDKMMWLIEDRVLIVHLKHLKMQSY